MSLLNGEMRAASIEDVVVGRQLNVRNDCQPSLCLYPFPRIPGRRNQCKVDQRVSWEQLSEFRPMLANLLARAGEIIDEDNYIIWS